MLYLGVRMHFRICSR